jgi:endonuclease/exonuclease/phosphatase family metal-dependent hydrolase
MSGTGDAVPGSPVAGTLSVATFNVHAGVDRHGVPFDVPAAAASIDADVLVVQELWWADGAPSPAERLAARVGGWWVWQPAGTGTFIAAGRGRLPGLGASAVVLDGGQRSPTHRQHGRGVVGTAVIGRVPILRSSLVTLPPLRRDGVCRGAIVVDVAVGGGAVRVIGTHMAHLSHGALRHFAAIRRGLTPAAGAPDGWVLAGDLNLWGAVVERVLPGWQRAVVGRTWPAHRPFVQPDHVLVAGSGLRVRSGQVHRDVGSDHRPVSAVLDVRGAGSVGSAVAQDDGGLGAGVDESQ